MTYKENFIEELTSCESWLTRSRSLRLCADMLSDQFQSKYEQSLKQFNSSGSVDQAVQNEVSGILLTTQFLWGLSIETGLKAKLLQTAPGSIEIRVVIDGQKNVIDAELQQFGVSIKDGHSLTKLADKAGFFRRENNPLFSDESDFKMLRSILEYLSDIVRWGGKYPTPIKSDDDLSINPDIQKSVYVLGMTDWVDPLLNNLHSPISPDKPESSGTS